MAETVPEKRRNFRVPMRVEATIRMMLPEETFTPFPMRGFTKDISLSGLRFVTTETSEDYYRLMIRKIRYARITMILPGSDADIVLLGKVVWIQYNNKAQLPVCTYGIAFEDLNPVEREAVLRCIDMIAQETAPGVSTPEFEVKIDEPPASSPA